jgi:exportin-T
VNNAIQTGLVDQQALRAVQEQILSFLQRTHGPGTDAATIDTASIENKLASTVTNLFTSFYATEWTSCFDDLLALTTTNAGVRDNANGVVFYLRVVNAVHDEIGDQLLSRSRPEQDKANMLKDLIRERDVRKIAASWQEILRQWRLGHDLIAELCLKAIGKWVSWIDIQLVVNQPMIELLFQQLERAQQTGLSASSEKARDAAVDVFTETISKKMQPADKIQLLTFLNLDSVVSQLITCPPLADSRGSSIYDVDLAETVAKLVNAVVVDIVKILENENSSSETWAKAERFLTSFLPHVLRFFSDEYDEVCSTVLAAMNDVLAFLRRTSQGQPPSPQRTVMLLPILKAIFGKMRYDETASWGDDDDKTDEAEFQELRKRLASLQQSIAASDEGLYIEAVSALVHDTLEKLHNSPGQVNWRDLDLALHEVYLLGEMVAKGGGGLYQKNKPNSPAAEKLIRMLLRMVQVNTGAFNHPAIQLQYMEICVRYSSFFEHNTEHIQNTLQIFLQLAHHSSSKVRRRSWYLLQKFIRQLRSHLGAAAEGVVQSLGDLLTIRAELPNDDDDDMSSDAESSFDAAFTSQLYLFEGVGCIAGATNVPPEKQVQLIQAVIQPLFTDIQNSLDRARGGSEQAVLQIHHDLHALGTLARGFSDWMPGSTAPEPNSEVKQAFSRVSEATLLALGTLKSSAHIRTAARFAFPRLIGMVGQQMVQQLPQWVDGLLSDTSSRDEMALFLRLLDQLIYGFKSEVSSFLDTMFTGLVQRVFAGISATTSGTDDEIELAELKREYLNFLTVILNNDLGSVLISESNQPMFETIVGTLDHFSKDTEDYTTAKMAFTVMSKMCLVWGGPDIVGPTGQPTGATAQPAMAGFDQYMISRFSPLSWAMASNSNFNRLDAQARQVLQEAAGLQKALYQKNGEAYLTWLRDNELRSMGMSDSMISEYLGTLSTQEPRAFKAFFAKFIAQAGR